MVSLGFIYGFFRVHLGFHVGFLIRISLGFLWVSHRSTKAEKQGKQRSRKAKNQRNRKA